MGLGEQDREKDSHEQDERGYNLPRSGSPTFPAITSLLRLNSGEVQRLFNAEP